MSRPNKFYGAKMSFATLSRYYPNDPDFCYFIFQQMIEDGNQQIDDYVLIVYAVNKNGNVMNGGNPLPLSDKRSHPFPAKQTVQFANIKLDRRNLDTLYPPGSGPSELRVYPIGHYHTTGYIVYTAETDNNVVKLINVTLNPSPPA